jgi:hypothetical protein
MKPRSLAVVGFALALLAGCASRTPPPPSSEGADVSKSRQKAFDEAVDRLHDQIHAPKADIAGVSQEDVTWEDSCLGCARTGESCKHVLTPGYRIILRVRDATYEYHTDRSGHDARLCGQGPSL